MKNWTVDDLENWDSVIYQKAKKFGLDCYPQEFHICDQSEMLGYMAYSGIPSHYPHWSYGKAYERTKTLYDYGVSGLPYEMVINSNPAIAYLMRDNSLSLQILTIAHVYGHNDFFKNNFTFRTTRAENTISTFKAHADLIRSFCDDPSIGYEEVEKILDAAHALSLSCRRNLHVKKLSVEDERKRLLDDAQIKADPYYKLHKRKDFKAPNLQKIPPVPDEDILLFIAEYNPFLLDWQRKLLQIVNDEAKYFIPQIDTKIMNEGWASYWHREIMIALGNESKLPQGLMMEFFVNHNQVVQPIKNGLNPYHLGYTIWSDIRHRYDEAMAGIICEDHAREYDINGYPDDLSKITGVQKIFEVRSSDRDSSFLRRFLNDYLINELDLYEYKAQGSDYVVSEVADNDGSSKIKETLIRNLGMNSNPVIKIVDGNVGSNRILYLKHEHDGRDLLDEYTKRTMEHLYFLWRGPIFLETIYLKEHRVFIFNEKGFGMRSYKDVKKVIGK